MGKKGEGKGKGKGKGVSSQEETSAPPPLERCPRCNSMNTKFCYNNNYNTAQPRHYCNDCRRYWTVGGSQRDIPVGGSSRKDKRWLKSSKDKTSQKGVNLRWSDMAIPPLVSGLVGGGPGSSHYFPSTGTSHPVPQVQPFNQPFAGGSNHFAVLQGNNLQAFQQQPQQNQPPLVPRNQINRPPQPSQQNHQLMNNMPQVSHQNLGGGLINSANNLLFGTTYANNIYSTALYPDPAFPQPAHATPGTPTMNNLTGFTSAPPVQDPYGSSLDHVNTLGGNNSAIDMSFYDSLPSLDPTSHHDPSIFDPQGDFGSPYNTLDFDPSFPDLPPFDPPY